MSTANTPTQPYHGATIIESRPSTPQQNEAVAPVTASSTGEKLEQRSQPWKAIWADLVREQREHPDAKDHYPANFGIQAHSLAA